MLWVVGFLILLVALMIPILAIVLDSPVVRRMLESRGGESARVAELSRKVGMLEDQVDDLTRSIDSLKEEQSFLHRLLENPERPTSARRLPPSP